MKILLVGGGGFIGFHLLHKLLSVGHVVSVFGRSASLAYPLPKNVNYFQGSTSDNKRLEEALHGIDAVVHLASSTVPSTADGDPSADVSTNLIGTINLLDAMVKSKVKRILYLSSGGTVYGIPQQVPIKESHRLAPICSYGIVKMTIEAYLELYARNAGLSYIVIRASNPYGSHQGKIGVQGIISTFLHRALKGGKIEIWGDGSVVRDFIFISDLVTLCTKALESDVSGIYNGASGVGCSVQNVAETVRGITGNNTEIIYYPSRNLDVPVSVLDVSLAQAEFNWSAKIDLFQGIEKTWEWTQSNYAKTISSL